MLRTEFENLMMRVQQGTKSFEHAMEAMYEHVVDGERPAGSP